MDFLIELKNAGFTSRLKRLSDALLYSTKDFYKTVGADIEPNWHLVFLILKRQGALSLTDISDQLQLSHPAIIKIVNNMKSKGYVETKTDTVDSRKQIITLTELALVTLPRLEAYWAAFEETVQDIMKDCPDFLTDLGKVEENLRGSSFKDRTLMNLNSTTKQLL
ncbi:MarR family transcriptional regulator [Dyadobacter flavalbus]|uniref:MarR family transcriptional regulator n=1 Tax=Dyadobacter flavalbus TaxID=2579942 RepID=A0A5M8QTS5_9BACT|nr:MarR family transcriptional regulator [Dyadobacter flavalbus]KAA6439675.1 MarR family transcriptional regulator [Dyadobacter flavalbus]